MDLLIVGASARAAAASARRIGLRPTCLDLFADADLASSHFLPRIDPAEYPDALAELADRLPPMPWLYTGAIENRPDLVGRISARHRLLGNGGKTLRAVRDPLELAEACRAVGLPAPEVRLDPSALPLDGSWLRKPLASGGGRGIRPWTGRGGRPGVYFQRKIEGLSLSVLCLGDGAAARCLGVTRQVVGKPSNRFAYRGTLAPWSVSDEVLERIERLARAIGDRFGLVGLFGIDLILADGHPWPIEVNPRYTASVEALEWALGRSLLAEHLRAAGLEFAETPHPSSPAAFVAKAIVFAGREFRWPEAWAWRGADPADFPEIGDVPHPGTKFDPGDPVLTVFAGGDSLEACRRELAGRLWGWRRRIRDGSGPDQVEGG